MVTQQNMLPLRPTNMRTVLCGGTSFEIGLDHGKQAASLVKGSIAFYAQMFKNKAGIDWQEVKQIAANFHETILKRWPSYEQEMRGVATGAEVSVLDIVALNVRTEIAFGLSKPPTTDGCTTAYYRIESASGVQAWQGQNWDWQPAQAPNLIYLVILRGNDGNTGPPTIKMITEAGIIGKIGINSHGVGVCFNALAVPGCDHEGLPAHLALRIALEAESAQAAQKAIMRESIGGRMASCAYVLAGDVQGAFGCEFAATEDGSDGTTWQQVENIDKGAQFLVHCNDCLMSHPHSKAEQAFLEDSPSRMSRMRELLKLRHDEGIMDTHAFAEMFKDEDGFPRSINRKQLEDCRDESLFNIVIFYEGSGRARARVKMGRPSEDGELFEMTFGNDKD